jgi:hypothetical protein
MEHLKGASLREAPPLLANIENDGHSGKDKHSGILQKFVNYLCKKFYNIGTQMALTGNTKGGSITVPLTSWLTGLESAV